MNMLDSAELPTTQQMQLLDKSHHLHPFTEHKSLHEAGSRIITKADGIYIWDSQGNRIIDGMAGLWCVNVGYGRTELIDAAARQMAELPYYNTFFRTSHPPAVELSQELAGISPRGLNHVFLTNSGSEANDTAIRMARTYWAQRGKPGKSVLISRTNAYHGSTVGAASLGGMSYMHAQGGLPIPGIEHIRQPYWYRDSADCTGIDEESFGILCADALLEKIEELGEENVAAFIAEPIQGAGGVIIPPDSYWPRISEICGQYEILLIVDEVICGFGRTGRWFGSDYYGIRPDMMTVAKGLSSGYMPVAGLMVSDKVAETLIDSGEEFAHGFTYSGHPVACAVAIENIRILRRENIVETVDRSTAPRLGAALKSLQDLPLVGEVRSAGLLGAVELMADPAGKVAFDSALNIGTVCRDICFRNGLVMRAVGDTMVLSPPLVISESQIDDMIDVAMDSIKELENAI